jgi:uncharacterized RDD family membrane protein YckC
MTDHGPGEQGYATADASDRGASADLGKRFLARLIDFAILWVVYMVLIIPIVAISIFSGSYGGAFGGFNIGGVMAALLLAAIGVGYFALMESSLGQTLGKMVTKIKTEGPDGGNPSLEMAIKRNIWIALGIIPVIGGLAELAAAIYIAVTISQSPTHTGWHDTFAGGTRVVTTA